MSGKKYDSLDSLIQQDGEANKYYSSLPDYVKEMMAQRSHNVNSFESLKDYAENLTHGDQ